MSQRTSTRGLLDPNAASGKYSSWGRAPSEDVAWFLEQHWGASWNLAAPYTQELLLCPSVYVVFGTHSPGVHGVVTRRFTANLAGEGWVFGTRFRPGAFRPFVERPMRELRDRVATIGEIFGTAGEALAARVREATDADGRIAVVESFFRTRAKRPDREAQLVERAVGLARTEHELSRVDDLAARLGVSVRVLEIKFREYVGLSPKEMLLRCRVQEAAERLLAGEEVDFAELALTCGYVDQAHLIREFKLQTGATPGQYARRCAEPPPVGAGPVRD